MASFFRMSVVAWLLLALSCPATAGAQSPSGGEQLRKAHKVLAIMSYEPDNTWSMTEKEGIDQALSDYEIQYFYLNTKEDKDGGWKRAKEALKLLEEFRPEAVIAADDNAQEMFVLPYLKDKIDLPVVFCGVNDEAGKYGYPSANITGVIEVKHYLQTISFAKLIIKNFRQLLVIYKENPSNAINVAQIRREIDLYPVQVVDILSVASMAETRAVMEKMKNRVEAILVINLSGISDDRGRAIDNTGAIKELSEFGVPILATEDYSIAAGALCGVVQSGRAQGLRAGQMVREIMGGRKPLDIPVEMNLNGQRCLNLSTARRLDLPLGREVILGSKLLR